MIPLYVHFKSSYSYNVLIKAFKQETKTFSLEKNLTQTFKDINITPSCTFVVKITCFSKFVLFPLFAHTVLVQNRFQ